MSNVPTNLIPTRITGLPEYTGDSTLGFMPYVLEGRTYKVQFSNIAAVGAVPSSRVIATGNGLEGGGDLSQDRTISIISHGVGYSQLDFTGVTAGTYGAADTIPVLTVDATGRVSSVVDTPVALANYVPSSRTVTAGAGLTGGGQLDNNITIALNPSNATPLSLGVASAGTGVQAARDDHVHPAVDLTDTSETQGVLPLGRGGTGIALSPVVGAVIYADNDSLNQTTAGNSGQVLTSAGGSGAPYWQTITGAGTVTDVSVATANGFAGTVTDPTTTPEITLSTTVTGMVKGDGTALSAATAGVDYVAPGAVTTSGLTMATARLLGRTTGGSGAVEEITVGTGLTLSAGTLSSSVTGTVTSVDASGGATGLSFSGGPITSSGTLTLGGTLAVASGGTGAATAGAARTALGAAASGANTDITSIALTSGTVLNAPTSGTDIVNKTYADSIASGINFHQAVRLATTTALPANTYNNGTSGVGATLTGNANGALSLDGVAVVVGNRVLIKDEVAQANNGVYTVTQVGNGSAPYILTRAIDFDSAGSGVDQIDAGDFFLVTAGSTLANTSWVQQTPLPITVGTTALVFLQFGAPITYSAGTGLSLAGTVFSITNTGVTASTYGSASQVPVVAVNAQGQITSASSTSIAIAASQVTSGVLAVANGGTGQSSYTDGQLLIGNSTGNTLTKATLTAGTNISITNGAGAITINATDQYTGTVTSVDVSGGTTGLTTSGGPVTSSGTITLAGTLNVANGGTGATSLTSGYLVKGNGTSAVSASVVYDNGTNVGIGTSSPSGKLDVTGSLGRVVVTAEGEQLAYTFNGFNYLTATGPAATLQIQASGASGKLTFATANVERMRIDSSGNVGIGTTSPGAKLAVAGSGKGTVFGSTSVLNFYSAWQYNSTDIGYIGNGSAVLSGSGATDFGINAPGARNLCLGTNDTERARFDSSGNFLVGKTSSTYSAAGRGVIELAGSSQALLELKGGTSSHYIWNNGTDLALTVINAGAMVFSTNSTTQMTIASGGNVTLAKKIIPNVTSTTSTATLTPNADSDTLNSLSAQAVGLTVAAPSGTASDGQKLIVRIKDNGSSQTISWNAIYVAAGATLPTATTAGKWHHVGLIYNASTTTWMCVAATVQA